MSDLCVYWIKSGPKRYIGKPSKGVNHRLKQHNGELRGGAKTTRLKPGQKPWVVKHVVIGFTHEIQALRFEYALRREFKQHEKTGRNNAQRMLALETTIAQPHWGGKLTYI
jgi:hypothetical protein